MKKFIALILTFFCLTSCCSFAKHMPKIKHEKLLEMQQCIYNTNNVDKIMQSVISTLYDSDFVITEINSELGFLSANKIFKSRYINKKRVAGWSAVLALATAYTVFSYGSTAASMYSPSRRVATEMKDKTFSVDVNVYIEKINETQTRVVFKPVAKVLQNADGFSFFNSYPVMILRFYKPDIYKEFFTQVGVNLVGTAH